MGPLQEHNLWKSFEKIEADHPEWNEWQTAAVTLLWFKAISCRLTGVPYSYVQDIPLLVKNFRQAQLESLIQTAIRINESDAEPACQYFENAPVPNFNDPTPPTFPFQF